MRIQLLALLAASGLATAAAAQDSTSVARPPKKQATLIALWEVEQINGTARDAYDVVRMLRPRFLQIRSQGTAGDPRWREGPRVVVDEAPRGGTEVLRSIPIGAIQEIRYMSGPEAANRYGPESHAGVILVTTR